MERQPNPVIQKTPCEGSRAHGQGEVLLITLIRRDSFSLLMLLKHLIICRFYFSL
jgi:hypothetical protein